MAATWFYEVHGKEWGPVSPVVLRQLAEIGFITPDTLVRKRADGPWVCAETVKGLFRRNELPPATVAPPVEDTPISHAAVSPVEKELPPLPAPLPLPASAVHEDHGIARELNAGDNAQRRSLAADTGRACLRAVLYILWGIIGLALLGMLKDGLSKLGNHIVLSIRPEPPTESFAETFALVWATVFCIVVFLWIKVFYRGFRRIKEATSSEKPQLHKPKQSKEEYWRGIRGRSASWWEVFHQRMFGPPSETADSLLKKTPRPARIPPVSSDKAAEDGSEDCGPKPKSVPYVLILSWVWTIFFGYVTLKNDNIFGGRGPAALYPCNLPFLAAGLLGWFVVLLPVVGVVIREWRKSRSLAVKWLVVAIVLLVAVRIERECRPPVPWPEVLRGVVPNPEQMAEESTPPKGLVSPLVPLIALVATVLWLCFGHRARILKAEKHCLECSADAIHERPGADHVLLFLIFVTTAAEALLPPAPPSFYYFPLFLMFVSTAFMWLPFWVLASVKVGGWRCRACGHKQRTVFAVGTRGAFVLYVVVAASVISLYEHIRDTQMRSDREEATQAFSRVEDRFSKMVEPGSHRSGTVGGADGQSEKGAEPHGLIGEMERLLMEAMNSGEKLGDDYRRELQTIGWNGILEPTRLWDDRTMTRGRAVIGKAKEVVEHYRAKYLSMVQSLRLRIDCLNVDSRLKQQTLEAFDATATRSKQMVDRLYDLEEKCVDEAGCIFDFLEAKSGSWWVVDGKLLFQGDQDAEKYNAFLSRIGRYVKEEEQIKNENAEAVKAKLARMKGAAYERTGDAKKAQFDFDEASRLGFKAPHGIVANVGKGTAVGSGIHDAVRAKDRKAVSSLVRSNPACLLEMDEGSFGSTPLHTAAERGSQEMAELLLALGADVNIRARNGETPLITAVGEHYQELARMALLNTGLNCNELLQ